MNVIPFTPMLSEKRLHAALAEITDETTEAVVIITMGADTIGVRTFGDRDKCRAAIRAARITLSAACKAD